MTFTLNEPISALKYEIRNILLQNYASFEIWYYLMVSNINKYSYVNNIQKPHLKWIRMNKKILIKKKVYI